jgi:hypothetical protein
MQIHLKRHLYFSEDVRLCKTWALTVHGQAPTVPMAANVNFDHFYHGFIFVFCEETPANSRQWPPMGQKTPGRWCLSMEPAVFRARHGHLGHAAAPLQTTPLPPSTAERWLRLPAIAWQCKGPSIVPFVFRRPAICLKGHPLCWGSSTSLGAIQFYIYPLMLVSLTRFVQEVSYL